MGKTQGEDKNNKKEKNNKDADMERNAHLQHPLAEQTPWSAVSFLTLIAVNIPLFN
jgi:hypothetical protein